MSFRSLEYYGSEVLRKQSRELVFSTEQDFIETLINDMSRILYTENGLGLAAPQSGENVKLFILNPEELDLSGHSVFINPRLEISGPFLKDEEGCLSIPGIFELVRRPSHVSLTALDQAGRSFSLELDDYAARAAQHEYDHLEGILFIDRLSPIKKRLIRRRLSEIKEEYRSGKRIL
ncbi:MAG: peptide deformylase [Candidatus Aegiribacteria sp.]|nr:peptide deformylase [Candidatus Aegiribacteria sp.]